MTTSDDETRLRLKWFWFQCRSARHRKRLRESRRHSYTVEGEASQVGKGNSASSWFMIIRIVMVRMAMEVIFGIDEGRWVNMEIIIMRRLILISKGHWGWATGEHSSPGERGHRADSKSGRWSDCQAGGWPTSWEENDWLHDHLQQGETQVAGGRDEQETELSTGQERRFFGASTAASKDALNLFLISSFGLWIVF